MITVLPSQCPSTCVLGLSQLASQTSSTVHPQSHEEHNVCYTLVVVERFFGFRAAHPGQGFGLRPDMFSETEAYG